MTIRIEIEGLEELKKRFTNLEVEFAEAAMDAVEETAFMIRTEVIREISEPGTGRVYEKSRPKRTHVASAPGQPPATDTGRLIASIYPIERELAGTRFAATVGSRLAYAAMLEVGTRRMAARPVWMPVSQREGAKLGQRLEQNLKEKIRR